ncbi:aspartate aminotransferase family protein [Wenzhouxiangella sp. AB-CW3]|uniref:aspartate aminotransferase family protein n=1 Tax=Wenzhouxiangella sp. AB-CW3 TaxID=2771012 RepID=UPI00168BC11F|nr:aspartate aminotransferase family protein [Wenzhouxiangella sp. AB-CW3]QOC21506.1 aspartate aminotransferase family protein [Wenzhouxiangella sp. AB-CW3]
MSHLFDTYARMPVDIVRGEGPWLFDTEGQGYLDAISGIGVCSLGHAHPRVAEAIGDQAGRLIHTANIVGIPLQEQLAARLADISGLDRAFLANSGAEAIECALKLARLHAHARQVKTPTVLVTDNAFHGRTLAAISASGNPALQQGFAPLVDGFVRVPFGDAQAALDALDRHPEIVAVLVEPIQGEGGVRVPPDGYLPALRKACDRHDALLLLDEIQTGLCRTGHWFAHQHEATSRPDVLLSAKALGNGVPIGACLARGNVADLMRPGSHGTTFGGNPLACRAALEVLAVMDEEDLAARSNQTGQRLRERLSAALADHPAVHEIRGRGLMIGIELTTDCGALKLDALKQGVIINVTRGNTVRLLPPLIIDQSQCDQIADTVIHIIQQRFPS